MAEEKKSLSEITRSLMLGVSVGTVALTQVGCETRTVNATAGPGATTAAAPATTAELELCSRAVESGSAADVNALLVQYPRSSCIVPLLTALPEPTLAGLSPSALRGLDPAVQRAIPAEVRNRLPVRYEPVEAPVERVRDFGFSDPRGGGDGY